MKQEVKFNDQKIGFFEEEPGVKSSTRLNSFILLCFFMIFNLLWVYGGNVIDGNILMLDLVLLVGIFTPKYLHKVVESKTEILKHQEKEKTQG